MVSIAGYVLTEKLYDGLRTTIYRGIDRGDLENQHSSIILKVLKAAYPTASEIAQFHHEFQVAREFNSPRIVKVYASETHFRSHYLVIEDFGGISLSEYLQHHPVTIADFFTIALQIVDAVAEIHTRLIIHKDIKPQNIIIDPDTQHVKITDFGISSRLSRENPSLKSPNALNGTLAYIAPEQTGRMNRAIDPRSDLYAIGITFYEMLAGHLPFQTTDPMEMVHCHIAKPILPLHQIYPQIPIQLSHIVSKLLAKTPEDRYQTAHGLKADLSTCWMQWQETQAIAEFPLGQTDIPHTLQIPQKLYGRESEVTTLLDAFEHARHGSTEVVVISGYSGSGKSALVQEIHKPVVQQRGYIITGKFDQLNRNTPYTSFIQAFRELVRQILTESDEQIATWRSVLLTTLGSNGQLIIDVIPEVELIIGSQPPIPPLPAQESQNRFNHVFQNFVHVFAQPQHPLVLFLDDLQWADSASLKLIQRLATSPAALLLIGAYRDNEVTPTHPLKLIGDDIQEAGKLLHSIVLKPLSLTNISHLLSETLHTPIAAVTELATLCLEKTNGNPFFLNQFLKTLYEQEFLCFDAHYLAWKWDIRAISTAPITDNVVELMAGKIQQLPIATQNILKLAACIGHGFDLKTLTLISNTDAPVLANALWPALKEGLILQKDDAYALDEDNPQLSEEQVLTFAFLHDRVQQAAYSLIPTEQQQILHYKIGQILHRKTSDAELESRLFDITYHFNRGLHCVRDRTERLAIAHLNQLAGQKAKAATAYEAALQCLRAGMQLLDAESWQTHYQLAYTIHVECAECEYLIGNFTQAEQLFNTLLDHVQTDLERANLYVLKITLYTNLGKSQTALDLGLEALRLFEVDLQAAPVDAAISQEVSAIQVALSDRAIADLAQLPAMEDPQYQAIMDLLMSLAPVTYFLDITLWTLVISKMVNLSLQFGNHPVSAFGYVAYGLLTGSAFGDYRSGYTFGQLGIQVNQFFQHRAFQSKVHMMMGVFIGHWCRHAAEDLVDLHKAFLYGNENGDPTFAIYAANVITEKMLIKGDRLAAVYQESVIYGDYAANFQNALSIYFHGILQQMVRSLRGETEAPTSFSSEQFQEDEKRQEMEALDFNLPLHYYYITKLQLCYLMGDYESALAMAQASEQLMSASFGLLRSAEHYFYYTLTLLALYPTQSSDLQSETWKQLLEYQAKFHHWAEICPDNFLHKYLLITAEIARLEDRPWDAMNDYDRAITAAHEASYTQNAAIANELAAKFYLAHHKPKIAQTYLSDAQYAYKTWGATVKVEQLNQHYPELLAHSSHPQMTSTETLTATSTTQGSSTVLDLSSVLKASQTLSQEIVLADLLATMITLLIENAGAQKGCLILDYQGTLFIEAQASTEPGTLTVLQSTPIIDSADLPHTLINYVERTHESLVLNNATQEGRFTRDPYILQYQPASILCTPIVNQGKRIGILYLENNLAVGSFTPDRLEVLHLLSTQSAISIENARLYQDLKSSLDTQTQLTQAYERFVPHQFLQLLNKSSIVEVQLGDQVELEMSVMFTDICDFTTLSERMTPEENFRFINSYLSRMETAITKNDGFIDKYIGDAIMALFHGQADNALKAAIAMQDQLVEYNQHRARSGYDPIRVGLGINTGSLMLGTVGGANRMDSTVISDAVNLAARLEKLTRNYQVPVLISHHTVSRLTHPTQFSIRLIDQVRVKGKSELVTVYEVFDADPPEIRQGKHASTPHFAAAIAQYHAGQYFDAADRFERCLQKTSGDRVAHIYLQRCLKQIQELQGG